MSVRLSVCVTNKRGLHARTAATLARAAGQFDATVTLHKDGATAAATSVMDLLMLGAAQGCTVDITAKGPAAAAAAKHIADLIAQGFQEE